MVGFVLLLIPPSVSTYKTGGPESEMYGKEEI